MGRIVSFIIVVLVLIGKYFAYKYFDDKKIADEVEQSKTVWVESFKKEYLANCTKPGDDVDPSINLDIYCNCMVEKTQAAAAFPTAYDADKYTAEQYDALLGELSDKYYNSDLGKKNTEECFIQSTAKDTDPSEAVVAPGVAPAAADAPITK